MGQVNFRIDDNVKVAMEEVCSSIGLSVSTAFNLFAKKLVRERRIPFELTAEPVYAVEWQKKMDTSIQELKEGKGKVITSDDIRAMVHHD